MLASTRQWRLEGSHLVSQPEFLALVPLALVPLTLAGSFMRLLYLDDESYASDEAKPLPE